MKHLLLIFPLLLSSLLHAENISVELVGIEDGDTLLVALNGKTERIQLQGMDAPESILNPKLKVDAARSGKSIESLIPLGEEAMAFLSSQITPGEKLILKGDIQQRDRYGRISTEVFSSDNESLNIMMVAQGYARPLGPDTLPKPLDTRLLAAWKLAEEKQRGLFSSQPEMFHAWVDVQKRF